MISINKKKKYIVITGDLVNSTIMSDRERVSNNIYGAIKKINNQYLKEFHAGLVLTKGIDEISAVLIKPHYSFEICRCFNNLIYPNIFRFAIASGLIDIFENSKKANSMDGPAFHLASSLMEELKGKKFYYNFALDFKIPEYNGFLNNIANLLQVISNDWTKKQREIIELYMDMKNQSKVAQKINVTQQNISEILLSANYKTWKNGLDYINKILNEYQTKEVGD